MREGPLPVLRWLVAEQVQVGCQAVALRGAPSQELMKVLPKQNASDPRQGSYQLIAVP